MKKIAFISALTFLLAVASGSTAVQVPVKSLSGEIAGEYSTSFNKMTLSVSGNHVTGTYEYSGGRVEGTLSGHTLTGTWTQTNGKGKIIFEFNDDFSSFTGKWGYNNAVPSSNWSGTKISGGTSTSNTAVQVPVNPTWLPLPKN